MTSNADIPSECESPLFIQRCSQSQKHDPPRTKKMRTPANRKRTASSQNLREAKRATYTTEVVESPASYGSNEVVVPHSIATPIPPGEWTEFAAVAEHYVKDQGTRVHSKN